MNTNIYVCPQCKYAVRLAARPRLNFMGFARIPCPTCHSEFQYPLEIATALFYWLLLIGNVGLLTYLLSQGQTLVPNPFGIVLLAYVLNALVKDYRLKRHVVKISQSAIEAPPLQVTHVEDKARGYHLLIAVMLPYVALPWGIVNLCFRKKSSGLMLTIPSAIVLLIMVLVVASWFR